MVDLSTGGFESPFFGAPGYSISLGGMPVTLGIVGLLDSFGRFAMEGPRHTGAYLSHPYHLVVTGLYRYVRNPMYVAVVITVLGPGLIFGNAALVEYGGLVWLLFHLFVLLYEEPTLRASFGSEYNHFCAGVPRWIPRLPHGNVILDSEHTFGNPEVIQFTRDSELL